MAPLPRPFDRHAFEIRSRLEEGRKQDAEKYARKLLSEGKAGPQAQAAAASVLNYSATSRGGRSGRKFPARWFEIGQAFEVLRESGMTYEAACLTLEESFGMSDSVIKRAVRFFRQAKAVNVD